MFVIKKNLIIFTPLEQFEINSIINYFLNDILSGRFILEYVLQTNFLFKITSPYINTEFYLNNSDLTYFIIIREKLRILPDNSFSEIEFSVFDNLWFFDNFLSLLPSSDFFLLYHYIFVILFCFIYDICFLNNIILFPLNFWFFYIINFVLITIKNMNNNLIKYSPYLISLFFMIFLLNILGLIPFVKCLTATISITFFLSFSSFLGLNIEGILIHKIQFFSRFAPSGIPFAILPGLILIELVSYAMRPNSLAVRLFANMLAGHVLIKLFITFCLDLSGISLIVFIGCILFICSLLMLESFISFLQAYIFTFIVLLYLNDVVNIESH